MAKKKNCPLSIPVDQLFSRTHSSVQYLFEGFEIYILFHIGPNWGPYSWSELKVYYWIDVVNFHSRQWVSLSA